MQSAAPPADLAMFAELLFADQPDVDHLFGTAGPAAAAAETTAAPAAAETTAAPAAAETTAAPAAAETTAAPAAAAAAECTTPNKVKLQLQWVTQAQFAGYFERGGVPQRASWRVPQRPQQQMRFSPASRGCDADWCKCKSRRQFPAPS